MLPKATIVAIVDAFFWYVWKILITESVLLIITRNCYVEWAVYFLATNNAEMNSDILVFVLLHIRIG